MTWYNPATWFTKANPAQELIARDEGPQVSSDVPISFQTAFYNLETVNRGVNMIVSACASLDFDIKDMKMPGVALGTRKTTLNNLLNYKPNPNQSSQEFRTAIFTDLIIEGNIFIYYDGAYMYHLPAVNVKVIPDPKTFVSYYLYNDITRFSPNEIIHIKDINTTSIYRGTSRLQAAERNIQILYKMQIFQEQFFKNGAVPSMILTTENTLSETAKQKTILGWAKQYNPNSGAKKPLILDSGMKPVIGISASFQEMDFDTSIKTHDTKILKALGVPPILLDGGNNANISPNLRLFYLETVIPIITKLVSGFERFFGYDISPITSNVSALQPELKEIASYYTTLVNGGVITPNEARLELRYEKDTDPASDKLRVPANIAGSAADPSQGGAPKKPQTEPKPAKEFHGQE